MPPLRGNLKAVLTYCCLVCSDTSDLSLSVQRHKQHKATGFHSSFWFCPLHYFPTLPGLNSSSLAHQRTMRIANISLETHTSLVIATGNSIWHPQDFHEFVPSSPSDGLCRMLLSLHYPSSLVPLPAIRGARSQFSSPWVGEVP